MDGREEFDLPSYEGEGVNFVDVFSALIGFAFDPVAIEIFEDSVEVFGCLGESVPLFGVVFQEIFVLVVLCFLHQRLEHVLGGHAWERGGLLFGGF